MIFSGSALDARRTRFVAQQAFKSFHGEAFLPAPNACFRLSGLAHNTVRAEAIGREQNNLSSPDVFLRSVPIPDQGLQAATVNGRDCERYSGAHHTDSHIARPAGIPMRIQMSDLIH
jgi:hypothetical protein